ncbi:hypothetical protein D3C81_1179120 [compost metagenome]
MTATGNSDRPIEVITVPVTSGGKKRTTLDMNGAISMPKNPAAMVAPKIPCRPTPGMPAMATMLPTAAKLAPIITGMRIPTGPIPNDWMMVATPATSRSALIRNATSSRDKPAAWPMISGTAIAPPYISSTCCRPTRISWNRGRGSRGGAMGMYAWRDSDMQHLEFCSYSRIQARGFGRRVFREESQGSRLKSTRSMLA